MKVFRLLLPLSLVIAGLVGAAGVACSSSGVVGQMYVNDNTAGVNTVAGIRPARGRHADTARRLAVRGRRRRHGAGIGSQGALQLSADGRYLLAVDAGSNQISVLRIKPHGTTAAGRRQPPSRPTAIEPVSIAVHAGLVYVANAGAAEPNYTGFTLNPAATCAPIGGSTVALPDGSQPGDVLFSGDGTNLVGTRVATSMIDSFSVVADGRLRLRRARRSPRRDRPVRQRVQADQPEPALRLERPRRHQQGQRLGLHRRRRRQR